MNNKRLIPVSYRLPLYLVEKLKSVVAVTATARNLTHAVELAISEWIERNQPK